MELIDIMKLYDGKKVLDKFSLNAERGKPICLYGSSGCGKTTVLNIVAGLTGIDRGQIRGTDKKRIAYLFQEDRLIESSTTGDNIMLSARDNNLAEKIIEVCEVSDYLSKYPAQLSGGMKRRIAIARAVAFDGDIVLLDELFNGIDERRTKRIALFLREYLNDKICIVVSHNLNDAEILGAQLCKME